MQVTVISPEASMFDGEADAVVAPAFDGEVGILPNHAPFMTLLGEGTLTVRAAESRQSLPRTGRIPSGRGQPGARGRRTRSRREPCVVTSAVGSSCWRCSLAWRRTSAAQETGTPIFKAPYRAFTITSSAFRSPIRARAWALALEGFYRYGSGPYDFSLRGGFADCNGARAPRFLIGGDFRTQVVHYSESFPLDGALTLGLGGQRRQRRRRRVLHPGRHLARPRASIWRTPRPSSCPTLHPVIVPGVRAGAATTWTSPSALASTSVQRSLGDPRQRRPRRHRGRRRQPGLHAIGRRSLADARPRPAAAGRFICSLLAVDFPRSARVPSGALHDSDALAAGTRPEVA